MKLRPVNELTPKVVEWLWPGFLVVGNIVILDGDPGLGKSLLTIDLASRLTSGRPWPDGAASPGPAPVLFLCDEDGDHIVVPRLKNAGADLSRVYLWPRVTDGGLPRLPSEIARVEEIVKDTGAKLIVIDPIMAFLDKSVDVNTDANVRRALRPLMNLAETHGCAILLVRHLNKDDGPQSLYRGGGSIAFVAACRTAWLVGRDPRNRDRYVLSQPKNNYAPIPASLAYALPADGPRVEWHGQSHWSADDVTVRRRPRRRRDLAAAFVRSILADGPRNAREIWDEAVRQGFSERTMRRARKDVKIEYQLVRTTGKPATFWCLPGQNVPGHESTRTELDEMIEKLDEQWPASTPLDANEQQLMAVMRRMREEEEREDSEMKTRSCAGQRLD